MGGPHVIEVPTDKEEGHAAVGELRKSATSASRLFFDAQAASPSGGYFNGGRHSESQ